MRKRLMAVLTVLVPLVSWSVTLHVGDEKFMPSDKTGYTYEFSSCAARASYSESKGFVLTFWDDSEVLGDISWNGAGLNLKVGFEKKVVLLGDITSSGGGLLEINGPGTLQIINGKINPYSADVKLFGAVVEITSRAGEKAISTSGSVAVELSCLSIAGYGKVMRALDGFKFIASMILVLGQDYSSGDGISNKAAIEDGNSHGGGCGGISIDGCVLTIVEEHHSENAGLYTRGRLSVYDSVVTIASEGECFHAYNGSSFGNVLMLGVSHGSCSVYGNSSDDATRKAFFADGKYVFGAATATPAIDAGHVEIDGGNLEVCAPDGGAVESYDFTMKDGALKMVDSVDYSMVIKEMLAEGAVMGVISACSTPMEWTTLHTQILGDMIMKLTAVVDGATEGRAEAVVKTQRFCQTGGSIDQGTALYGCAMTLTRATFLGTWYTPAFCGGSLKSDVHRYDSGVFDEKGYYDTAPTNALGQVLTRVDYEPYWVYKESGDAPTQCEVVFDANGGSVATDRLTFTVGNTYGTLPVPTWTGYMFLGWYTAANGGTQVSSATLVTGAMTLYAHWSVGQVEETDLDYYVPDRLPAAFYLCREGAENISIAEFEEGEEILMKLYYVNKGTVDIWKFENAFQIGDLAWGEPRWEDKFLNAGDDTYESWRLPNLPVGEYDMTCVLDYGDVIPETDEENNTRTIHFKVAPKGSLNLFMVVSFNANGGTVSPSSKEYAMGATCGELPVPVWPGYVFEGWYTSPYQGLGEKIKASTVITHDVVFYARWKVLSAVDEVSGFPKIDESAVVYNGYLYQPSGRKVVGAIEVKVSKLKKSKKLNSDTAKLTVGIKLLGESKKLTASISENVSIAHLLSSVWQSTLNVKGRGELKLRLGANGMSGSFEGCSIGGAPNVFGLKDAASKSAALAADAAYDGVYNLISDEGAFTLTVGKKGKVKVSGTLPTGKKVSVSSQLIVGEGTACIPVIVPKANLSFCVWLGDEAVVNELSGVVFGKAGTLTTGAVFKIDNGKLSRLVGDDTYVKYFPKEVSVMRSGNKWIVANGAKVGKVTLGKDGTVDESKTGENPAALKLTYAAKTGSFKGSFKAYVDNGGKPKAVTVTVTGVLINGVGYGSATVKKVGSIAITIE